jgi:SAM-dependent methyltransferase
MTIHEDTLTRDERSRLDFVLQVRKRWADTLFPHLRQQFDDRGVPADADLDQATEVVHELPLYPWFSWLERAQQKMMWRVGSDIVLRRKDELRSAMREGLDATLGSLELDPQFELPEWYTDIDIHLQPGGVWSDDLSAYVYELGAKIVMLRDNDGYRFHRLFVDTVLPDGVTSVLDIGCGFGKSTWPLVDRYPDAEVVGVDLSAPVLRLAHREAERQGKAIRFVQADGSDTGLESQSMDLVTGTMVLHELPKDVIRRTLIEAGRLLRPGGSVRFLEFWPTGDTFRDVTVYEHAERNNEPFFRDLFATDFTEVAQEAGLTDIRWVPFDEREQGMLTGGYPPREEWHFPWAVLCAEKEVGE